MSKNSNPDFHDFGGFAGHTSGRRGYDADGKRVGERFPDGKSIVEACIEYLEWNTQNPLYSEFIASYQGSTTKTKVAKFRAPTVRAFRLRNGIDSDVWSRWTQLDPIRRGACLWVNDLIFTMKFEAAAAELINPMIASRALGLGDKHELSGPNGGPIQTEEMSPRELLADRLARLAPAYSAAGNPGGTE